MSTTSPRYAPREGTKLAEACAAIEKAGGLSCEPLSRILSCTMHEVPAFLSTAVKRGYLVKERREGVAFFVRGESDGVDIDAVHRKQPRPDPVAALQQIANVHAADLVDFNAGLETRLRLAGFDCPEGVSDAWRRGWNSYVPPVPEVLPEPEPATDRHVEIEKAVSQSLGWTTPAGRTLTMIDSNAGRLKSEQTGDVGEAAVTLKPESIAAADDTIEAAFDWHAYRPTEVAAVADPVLTPEIGRAFTEAVYQHHRKLADEAEAQDDEPRTFACGFSSDREIGMTIGDQRIDLSIDEAQLLRKMLQAMHKAGLMA